jgi:hypothetical protein
LIFGKWGLDAPGSEGAPLNQGFDAFYGYNCQRYYPPHRWDGKNKVELTNNLHNQDVDVQDLIQQKALSFFDDHNNKPFFLYLPFLLPHAELLVPNDSIFYKFKGKFDEKPFTGEKDYDSPSFRMGGYSNSEPSEGHICRHGVPPRQICGRGNEQAHAWDLKTTPFSFSAATMARIWKEVPTPAFFKVQEYLKVTKETFMKGESECPRFPDGWEKSRQAPPANMFPFFTTCCPPWPN